jgi:hypothetical protein
MSKPNRKVRFQIDRFISNLFQSIDIFGREHTDEIVRSFGRGRDTSVGSHERVSIVSVGIVVRVMSRVKFAGVRINAIIVVLTVPSKDVKVVCSHEKQKMHIKLIGEDLQSFVFTHRDCHADRAIPSSVSH